MSINTAGLPSYNEQDTKKLISKTIANDKFIKETELNKLKELSKIYGQKDQKPKSYKGQGR